MIRTSTPFLLTILGFLLLLLLLLFLSFFLFGFLGCLISLTLSHTLSSLRYVCVLVLVLVLEVIESFAVFVRLRLIWFSVAPLFVIVSPCASCLGGMVMVRWDRCFRGVTVLVCSCALLLLEHDNEK